VWKSERVRDSERERRAVDRLSQETEAQLRETGGGEWGACRARDPVRKRERKRERV
jgi:hypothetical protein